MKQRPIVNRGWIIKSRIFMNLYMQFCIRKLWRRRHLTVTAFHFTQQQILMQVTSMSWSFGGIYVNSYINTGMADTLKISFINQCPVFTLSSMHSQIHLRSGFAFLTNTSTQKSWLWHSVQFRWLGRLNYGDMQIKNSNFESWISHNSCTSEEYKVYVAGLQSDMSMWQYN